MGSPSSPAANHSIKKEEIFECKDLIIDIPMALEPPRWPECCIYRVPKRLREVKPKFYTPRLVSIGPFHRHKRKYQLKDMEMQKVRYFWDFYTYRTHGKSKEDLAWIIKNKEKRIRRCYSETFQEIKKDEFVKMILLDAIFILELFCRIYETYIAPKETKSEIKALYEKDYILRQPCVQRSIMHDLLLLENQLPFFILQKLYSGCNIVERAKMTLLQLSCKVFGRFFGGPHNGEPVNAEHLTDLLRSFYTPNPKSGNPKPESDQKPDSDSESENPDSGFELRCNTELVESESDSDRLVGSALRPIVEPVEWKSDSDLGVGFASRPIARPMEPDSDLESNRNPDSESERVAQELLNIKDGSAFRPLTERVEPSLCSSAFQPITEPTLCSSAFQPPITEPMEPTLCSSAFQPPIIGPMESALRVIDHRGGKIKSSGRVNLQYPQTQSTVHSKIKYTATQLDDAGLKFTTPASGRKTSLQIRLGKFPCLPCLKSVVPGSEGSTYLQIQLRKNPCLANIPCLNLSWLLACLPCLKSTCLKDMQRFLEIPGPLDVNDSTEVVFRNLMALEQCHYPYETYICDYILLLDDLITTEADVRLLVENEIIDNNLGSNVVVMDLFNQLGLEIETANHDKNHLYGELRKDLREYYEDPWNRLVGTLTRAYFSDFFKGTATVVGIIVLVFTLWSFFDKNR